MESRAAAEVSWNAEEQMFAFSLMGDTQRLISLDDLRTYLLATPRVESDPRSNLPLVQAMVGELVGSLTSVTARTDQLERLTERAISEFGIDLDEELANVLRRAESLGFLAGDPPHPFADSVREACRVLREETPREIAEMTAKLLKISQGEYQPGDWGVKVTKALLIVAMAAGVLVAVSIPGALVIPVALSAGAGVVAVVSGTLAAWNSLPAS